jgi:hypothetical protein
MEERLVSEYIGNDADKFENANINWTAAILGQSIGPVWFFYRKSYLLGFGFIILTLIVGQIASALGISEAYYIMFFIYLFSANKLYLWDVRRKVNKILETNRNMSDDQLISLVREKGGTNGIAAAIYVIALIAIVVILYAMIFSAMSSILS